MAKEFLLTDIDQTAAQAAETLIIQLLRSTYPTLDLRSGTVLRELLVRPSAALDARENSRYDYLQLIRSLQLIAENPDDATAEDVNALLANYQLSMHEGGVAHGRVRVSISAAAAFPVSGALRLTTVDGQVFAPAQGYTVVLHTPETAQQLQLFSSNDDTYWYFLLPVVAQQAGANSNVAENVSVDISSGSIRNFVTAVTYEPFRGGVDPETVAAAIERMPVAISHRTLDSRASIEAILRSPDGGNLTALQAVSVQGFGDAAQRRDKHNAHGVAMGGKVDIYPRTFFQPTILTLPKTGIRTGEHEYQIELAAEDAPGYYAVRMVADAESVFAPEFQFGAIQADGGYAFTEVRSASGIQDTWHDILPTMTEVAYTVYQKGTLLVTGVPDTAETHEFKVEVYIEPALSAVQAFLDDPDYRNLKADYVARCPLLCLVSVRATLYARNPANVDIAAVTRSLRDHINGKNFTARLTESEIIALLHRFDIERVDLTDDPVSGFRMYGVVRDAAGVEHTLGPRTLTLEDVEDPTVLLTPETTVFAIESRNIFINVRPTT